MQTQEELRKEYEQQIADEAQKSQKSISQYLKEGSDQELLQSEYNKQLEAEYKQNLQNEYDQLLLRKEYEQQNSSSDKVPILSYANADNLSPADAYAMDVNKPATEEDVLKTRIEQIKNREAQLASDNTIDKLRLGIQDTSIGKINDIMVGIKGGSGYEIHKDSWGFKELLDGEKRKNILNDLAYVTGGIVGDLPAILGFGFISSPTGPLASSVTFGLLKGTNEALRQKRDNPEEELSLSDVGEKTWEGAKEGAMWGVGKFAGSVTGKVATLKIPTGMVSKGVQVTGGLAGGTFGMTYQQAKNENRSMDEVDYIINLISGAGFESAVHAGKSAKNYFKSDMPSVNNVKYTDSESFAQSNVDKLINKKASAIKADNPDFVAEGVFNSIASDTESLISANKFKRSDNETLGDALLKFDDPALKEEYLVRMAKQIEDVTGGKTGALDAEGKLTGSAKNYLRSNEELAEIGGMSKEPSFWDKMYPDQGFKEDVNLIADHANIEQINAIREARYTPEYNKEFFGKKIDKVYSEHQIPIESFVKAKASNDFVDTISSNQITSKVLNETFKITDKQINEMASETAPVRVSKLDTMTYSWRTAPRVIEKLGAKAYRFLYEPLREASALYQVKEKGILKSTNELIGKLTKAEELQVWANLMKMQNKSYMQDGEIMQKNVGDSIIKGMVKEGILSEKDIISDENMSPAQLNLKNHVLGLGEEALDIMNKSRAIRGQDPIFGLQDYMAMVFKHGKVPDTRDVQPWLIKYKQSAGNLGESVANKKREGSSLKYETDMSKIINGWSSYVFRSAYLDPVAQKWMQFGDALNAQGKSEMGQYIKDTALFYSGKMPELTPFKEMLYKLNNNMYSSVLAYSLSSILVQPMSLGLTISQFGVEPVLRSIGRIASSKLKITDISKQNELLSAVLKTACFDINYVDLMGGRTKGNLLRTGYHKMFDIGLAPMKMLDYVAREVTFDVAYNKYKREGLSDRDAKFHADETVNRTQGSGSREDVSMLHRTVLGKTLFAFQTFNIANLNYISQKCFNTDSIYKLVDRFKTSEEALKFAEGKKGFEVQKVVQDGQTYYAAYSRQKLLSTTTAMRSLVLLTAFNAIANTAVNSINDKMKRYTGTTLRGGGYGFVNAIHNAKYGYTFDDKLANTKNYKEMSEKYKKQGLRPWDWNRHRDEQGKIQKTTKTQNILNIATDIGKAGTESLPIIGSYFNSGKGLAGAAIGMASKTGEDIAIAKKTGKLRDVLRVANDASVAFGSPVYQMSRMTLNVLKEREKERKEKLKKHR